MPKKIKVNIFDDIREALQGASDYERGEAVNLRVTSVPPPPTPTSAKSVRRIPKR
jgi:hypothetical protein